MTLKQEQMLGAQIILLKGMINIWDTFGLAPALGQLADWKEPLYISAAQKLVERKYAERVSTGPASSGGIRYGYKPTKSGRRALGKMTEEYNTSLKHAKR